MWLLLGAEEQLCLFSICCREQQGKFFFVINFIFLKLCVFFPSQNPSCKHPAVSLGGGRCPASHSAGLSLLPTPHPSQGAQESAKIPPAQHGPCDLASHPKDPQESPGMQETSWLYTAASASPEHPTNISQKWLMLSLQRERRCCLLGGTEKELCWAQWAGIPQESSQPASCGWWNLSQSVWEAERAGG